MRGPRQLGFEAIVGESAAMADVRRRAAMAASNDLPVLLLGDTGTGKNLLARAIHEASARAGWRFVTARHAVPEGLLEGYLFGAEKGAFTGAVQAIPGLVAQAERGTLFVEEIGALTHAAQAKLLALAQDKAWSPLGGGARERKADVRLVAATHAPDLRPDLLHRLAAIVIRLPSLAERIGDVLPLAEAIARRYAAERGRDALPLTDGAAQVLLGRRWPGNVRELENVVRVALEWAWFEEAGAIEPRHLGDEDPPRFPRASLTERVEAFEAWLVEEAWRAAGGKITVAADLLGRSKSWLYERLKGRLQRPAA